MIRGYFFTRREVSRPFVNATIQFPSFHQTFAARLLVDTGADRTIIAPIDARRLATELGIDVLSLPKGPPGRGVGGMTETYTIQAHLTLDTYAVPLTLNLLDPTSPLPIPSLLGRDVISRFGLFVEQRTNRVLLLEPTEVAALQLP